MFGKISHKAKPKYEATNQAEHYRLVLVDSHVSENNISDSHVSDGNVSDSLFLLVIVMLVIVMLVIVMLVIVMLVIVMLVIVMMLIVMSMIALRFRRQFPPINSTSMDIWTWSPPLPSSRLPYEIMYCLSIFSLQFSSKAGLTQS